MHVGQSTFSFPHFTECNQVPTFSAVHSHKDPSANEMACLQKADNSPGCSSRGQVAKAFSSWKLYFPSTHT